MGSCTASPPLLKAWLLSWLKGGFLLRVIGLPAALLALHLEIYGSSPAAASLILHRLSRRLRLRTFTCTRTKGHERSLSDDSFFVARPQNMDMDMDAAQSPPQPPSQPERKRSMTQPPSQPERKRSMTPDKDSAPSSPLSGAASPTSFLPSPAPPSDTSASSDAAQSPPKSPSQPVQKSMTLYKDSSPPSPLSGPTPTSILPSPAPPSDASSASSDAASTSTTTLSHSSPKPAMPPHARSMSHADVVTQGKRLSLQFPMQPPPTGNSSPGFSPRSRPQSWMATPSVPTSPDAVDSPTEGSFLSFLAAQERYVLELKEELAKAEQDLKKYRQHWSTHESVKQRNDMRKVTQLQPLDTALASFQPDHDDEDGSTAWMQKEMERRKALVSGTRSSQRKVFSGSRHLRTLSLLSPDKNYSPSFPQPPDIRNEQEDSAARPTPLLRSSTSPDIANQIATTVNGEKYDLGGLSNMQREALLRTGKQMASDFKDGLLTFIEDIRQATVGEEAAIGNASSASALARGSSTKNLRKASDNRPTLNKSASSKKSKSGEPGGIGDDFWKAHGLSEPKSAPAATKSHGGKSVKTPQKQVQHGEDFEESWDSWDTPNDKYVAKTVPSSNSSDESDEAASPVSGRSSARTSTSSAPAEDEAFRDPKRSSIPWPDLVKLSPSNLKRTASTLMKEWEKNLTPPPESRDLNHSSGDYIGRSSSPAGLP
ncbi:hypothetical protein EJ04DRAFT_512563 [Polyplosphaeria fusca]|uniref:DUF4048 domain-containing protein n=1 Tax=Polyplosphaeria fusca TaxID=682080 RepID=A0A9P4QUU8_9PLEO|nr:hypothetical protein EJ04DRAFT_512563 [Polyplosphaeria fusca]